MKYLAGIFLVLIACLSFAQSVLVKPIVTVNWNIPNQRENNTALPIEEIGGYEIKYFKATATEAASERVILPGGNRNTHDLELPTMDDYKVSVAAFDLNGLYSTFVFIPYSPKNSKIKSINFTLNRKVYDAVSQCTIDTTCRVIR